MSERAPRILYVVCPAHGHDAPSVICVSREDAERWVSRQYTSHEFVIDEFELGGDGVYRP